MNDFCAFILTHGRPKKLFTLETLKKCGYTGKVYIVIDDEDKTANEYFSLYGDMVLMFNKKAVAGTIDEGDNFDDRRAIIYARNACFDLARKVGVRYFVQLDDDYTDFRFKQTANFEPLSKMRLIKNLDGVFSAMLSFLKNTGSDSVALAQVGDFLGGKDGVAMKKPRTRKCMNSFFCDVEKRFQFDGRINEDVNTYVHKASTGKLFFSAVNVALNQRQSQGTSGGMTGLYLDSGTYVKSFYTVMYSPSTVKVKLLQSRHPRLHHSVKWSTAVPVIIEEKYRK